MVEHGRVDLLSHRVCLAYLRVKWSENYKRRFCAETAHFRQAYGFFYHYLNMGMYLIFVACLTFTVTCTNPRYGARDGVMMLLENETLAPETTKYLAWMVRQVIACAIPITQPARTHREIPLTT